MNIVMQILELILNLFKATKEKDPFDVRDPEVPEEVEEKKIIRPKRDPRIDWFKNYYQRNGGILQEINLIGVRNREVVEKGVINDYVGFFTDTEVFLVSGTVDPSNYYTSPETTLNKRGVFHIADGFHKHIWRIGKHRGIYEAFVNDPNYCLPVRGWRDANFNFHFDEEDKKVKEYAGINFHRMHPDFLVPLIGKYSAGCVAAHDADEFNYILKVAKSTDLYKKYGISAAFCFMLIGIIEIPGSFI